MKLFIGNIPEDINDYDLRQFFGMFGHDDASFRIYDTGASGVPIDFGIATYNNAQEARQAISNFHKKELKGRPIIVREYVERSIYNERRAPAWAAQPYDGPERRRYDRRAELGGEVGEAITYSTHA